MKSLTDDSHLFRHTTSASAPDLAVYKNLHSEPVFYLTNANPASTNFGH